VVLIQATAEVLLWVVLKLVAVKLVPHHAQHQPKLGEFWERGKQGCHGCWSVLAHILVLPFQLEDLEVRKHGQSIALGLRFTFGVLTDIDDVLDGVHPQLKGSAVTEASNHGGQGHRLLGGSFAIVAVAPAPPSAVVV
jgi:hypothetical protein